MKLDVKKIIKEIRNKNIKELEEVVESSFDGEVKEGTPFKTYRTGKAGLTSINLFTGDISHVVSLSEIKEKALSIGVNLLYDTRLIKEDEEKASHFGKGWMLNLSQRLVKSENFNTLLEDKTIIYYDGNNDPHELKEKWYYDFEGIRYYVQKEQVFIDSDQKLKCIVDNNTHEVHYEASNAEGLVYVSTNSRMNYVGKDGLKVEHRYFISIMDNQTIEIFLDEQGYFNVPHFYNTVNTGAKVSKWLENLIGNKTYNTYYFNNYNEIKYEGDCYTFDDAVMSIKYVKMPMFRKDGKVFIASLKKMHTIIDSNGNELVIFDSLNNGEFVEIKVINQYLIDEENDVGDYLADDNITNINNQILQMKDYVLSLESQSESICINIISIIDNIKSYELQISLLEESDNQGGNISQLCYQIDALKTQLKTQEDALLRNRNELEKYIIKLSALEEQKEFLVNQNKESAQDFILDKEGNILGFDYYGKLVYISDKYENEIFITYDGDKLIEVGSEKQKMMFVYNSENLLEAIVDARGRKKEFVFNEFGELVAIKFIGEDNEKQSFEFSYDLGKLHCVHDASLLLTEIRNYDKPYRVCQCIYEESILNNGLIMEGDLLDHSFEYEENYVKCIDDLNEDVCTYYFDSLGRLIRTKFEDNVFNKTENSFIHYHKKKKAYEIHSISDSLLENEDNYFEGIVDILVSDLDQNSIPNDGLALAFVDIGGLNESYRQNNKFTLTVSIIDKEHLVRNYEQEYTEFNETQLYCPFVINKTDLQITIELKSQNSISPNGLEPFQIFKAKGHLYIYDENDHLIKDIMGLEETRYLEYVHDNPTIIEYVDKFGVENTIYQHFDEDDKLLLTKDSYGMVTEYSYDSLGNLVEQRTYHQSCPTSCKVTRVHYDGEGNIKEIDGVLRNELGEYPQSHKEYIPNTSLVRKHTLPSGQVMCYGYDYFTDELMSISSESNGKANENRMRYHHSLLSTCSHNGFEYLFEYDEKGRKTKVKIGNLTLFTFIYEDDYTYGNFRHCTRVTRRDSTNNEVVNIIDKLGRVLEVAAGGTTINYTYDNDNRLLAINGNQEVYETEYNQDDLVSKETAVYNNLTLVAQYSYNAKGFISGVTNNLGDKTISNSFTYDNKGLLIGVSNSDGLVNAISYDLFNRLNKHVISFRGKTYVKENIEYLTYDDNALDLVKEHTYQFDNKDPEITTYDYDVSGNIVKVDKDGVITRYKYDKLNRLIREDNGDLNKAITYKYDVGGNLLSKIEYPYTLE